MFGSFLFSPQVLQYALRRQRFPCVQARLVAASANSLGVS
ncbi:hypothetical protein AtDm6_0851 [Acetobacter tropicalis]|uniref:Uncharacterized protein n=1 Tax=Acetobacter tropicalis TaxID=104102 RepID=A0A094YT26_9PROT|nr:hypothetical protein AtDm6_0851 [Acetobacter tropicalis]